MLKQLFPGSTDFTEVIFKIPQISKHFSAAKTCRGGANNELSTAKNRYIFSGQRNITGQKPLPQTSKGRFSARKLTLVGLPLFRSFFQFLRRTKGRTHKLISSFKTLL